MEDFDDEKFVPWFWLNEHNSLIEYSNSISNKIELCYHYHLNKVEQNNCIIYPQGWSVKRKKSKKKNLNNFLKHTFFFDNKKNFESI
jgi:hypothetical protein